jgi:DNA-binding NarL/FixJ family response regulator
MSPTKIHIGLIDDHELFRDGLALFLSMQADMQVIFNVDSPAALHHAIEQTVPDVMIMDIAMPQQSGIDLCRQLLKTYPKLNIVFLTGNESQAYLEQALKAGGKGFVPKSAPKTEILEAIRKLHAGEYYFPPSLSQDIFKQFIGQIIEKPANEQLSDRELDVLRCFANGMSFKEVEEHLHISKKTVEHHKKAIFDKLGFTTNADLVKYAIKHHIVEI